MNASLWIDRSFDLYDCIMDLPLAFIFSHADRIKKHIYYTWWVLIDFAFSYE